MKRPVHWVLVLVGLVLGMGAEELPQEKPTGNPLLGLNASLEQLSTKVSPAVVHIEVATYGFAAEDGDDTKVQTLSKQRGSGSGVIYPTLLSVETESDSETRFPPSTCDGIGTRASTCVPIDGLDHTDSVPPTRRILSFMLTIPSPV